jgi:hypothetical protein
VNIVRDAAWEAQYGALCDGYLHSGVYVHTSPERPVGGRWYIVNHGHGALGDLSGFYATAAEVHAAIDMRLVAP